MLADEPEQVIQRLDDPAAHLVDARRRELERDVRILDNGRIDGRDGLGVSGTGNSDVDGSLRG
jgi:hypothetical protein